MIKTFKINNWIEYTDITEYEYFDIQETVDMTKEVVLIPANSPQYSNVLITTWLNEQGEGYETREYKV